MDKKPEYFGKKKEPLLKNKEEFFPMKYQIYLNFYSYENRLSRLFRKFYKKKKGNI
jgi:hypothetical protein